MTDEELAKEWVLKFSGYSCREFHGKKAIQAYLAGLKAGKDRAEADLATVAYMQGAEQYRPIWHKVADGDLPKGEDAVLIYWKCGDIRCFSVVEPYKVSEDTCIIAWCEIPKPPKEIE